MAEVLGAGGLRVVVPAKINLWLEVVRRREDGYHDLSSLMLPISVYDRIDVRGTEGSPLPRGMACDLQIEVSSPQVEGFSHSPLPQGEGRVREDQRNRTLPSSSSIISHSPPSLTPTLSLREREKSEPFSFLDREKNQTHSLGEDGKGEPPDITVSCDHPEVPCDASNLVWKAARAVMEASGARRALHIDIAKQIPVGAGLGGGSANAGAVLLAVNRLLGEPLNVEELHRIAWRLGADVPFFLQQRPALATGIGEHLEGVDGLPPYPLVLMKPALSVSTRWVYQSLKLTRGGSRIKVDRLLTSPWCVQEFMENDLESVTLQEFPVLAQMKEWLMAQGALGALMSGSGPTVFGVFPDRDHAQRVAEMGGEKWAGCWVSAAEVLSGFAAGS